MDPAANTASGSKKELHTDAPQAPSSPGTEETLADSRFRIKYELSSVLGGVNESLASTVAGSKRVEFTSKSKPSLNDLTEVPALPTANFLSVTTECSINDETVKSLGGREPTAKFIETLTSSFTERFSHELGQHLEDAHANATLTSHKTYQASDATIAAAKGAGDEMPMSPELRERSQSSEQTDSPADTVVTNDDDDDANEPMQQPSQHDLEDFSDEAVASSAISNAGDSIEALSETRISVEQMKVQLWRLDDIFHESNHERVFMPYDPIKRPDKQEGELNSDGYSQWVLVLRRVFEADNQKLKKVKLDIKSPLILSVLKEVVQEEKASLESKSSLKWPNDNVFRYRDRIAEAAARKGDLSVAHIDVLLGLIRSEYAARIADINDMFPVHTSSFEVLREVFWPGDIVIDKNLEDLRAYRVTDAWYRTEFSFRQEAPRKYLQVEVEYITYGGQYFGTVEERKILDSFEGIKHISDLSVYPLKYHSNPEQVKAQLIARGTKFVSLQGQHFKQYRGTISNSSQKYSRQSFHRKFVECPAISMVFYANQLQVDSRVMIDFAAISHFAPDMVPEVHTIADELADGNLSEDHLMIITNRIPLYSLRDKLFYTGYIDNINNINFNEQSLKHLVLPDTTKELVHAMIRSHVKGINFDDFTAGKGRGLIILLHGPAGVGKTMTAEGVLPFMLTMHAMEANHTPAVAEAIQRPLYTVTAGELGTSPEDLEQGLERALDISQTFRAVLLLDEADVFMEQRSTHDITRNALVSIFLRVLEYYQGVLILTTNRVKTIDDAFHSRIHLSLHYAGLNAKAREQIWRNLGFMTPGVSITDSDYTELAKLDLNGRQIKNIFGSCKALASDKGVDITIHHVKTVLEVMHTRLPLPWFRNIIDRRFHWGLS